MYFTKEEVLNNLKINYRLANCLLIEKYNGVRYFANVMGYKYETATEFRKLFEFLKINGFIDVDDENKNYEIKLNRKKLSIFLRDSILFTSNENIIQFSNSPIAVVLY